jgi:hypothetical protein
MQRIALLAFATLVAAAPLSPQQPAVRGYLADSTLGFLAPLEGSWQPVLPDSMLQRIGHVPIAGNYVWVVGKRAMVLRESFAAGADPLTGLVQGMIYWNPATEKVEFMAVAGPDEGQGRLFQGEYRLREDGTIEREYDVYYRTMADIPGEVFGGSRRRYLETVTFVTADSITTTLKWWHDGAWRPFGRFATGTQTRRTPERGARRQGLSHQGGAASLIPREHLQSR